MSLCLCICAYCKVSAHFFCRRCGVHVVHAPDFPHAAVANVNVHCIRPSTIKSLAVAFSRGGGVELPGMGNPVEGLYEVTLGSLGMVTASGGGGGGVEGLPKPADLPQILQ